MVEDQRARTASTRRRKPPEEWTILIRDNHAGYITWDEYLANQRILEANVARRGGTTPGAAKRGPALLAGLLRCGRCGRKLFVAYSGRGGRVPRYACAGSRTGRGPTTCLSLGGVTIEQAVTAQVLEAIQPVGIEAALAAVEQLAHTHTEQCRALELAVEKARYQAQRAERQYHTVDPDNRLVAGELEVRWNDALARVGQLKADLATLSHLETAAQPATAAVCVNLVGTRWHVGRGCKLASAIVGSESRHSQGLGAQAGPKDSDRYKVINFIGVAACNSIPHETHRGPARVRPSVPWAP